MNNACIFFPDAKCQVLANLANFSYDPINYGYIRNVGVLDIFIHVLKNEKDETLLHFATSGISNLCIGNINYLKTNLLCFNRKSFFVNNVSICIIMTFIIKTIYYIIIET